MATTPAGPRIITDATRAEMKKMLAEIQDGTYARNWIGENEKGRPWFNATRAREQTQILKRSAVQLRANDAVPEPGDDPAGRPGRLAG